MRAKWDEQSEKVLSDNFSIKPMSELMELLPQFNKEQIRNKAKRLGLKKEVKEIHYWNQEEDDFIIENYNILTAKEIAAKLGVKESQVRNRVNKLNLKKIDKWTKEDEELVRNNYNTMPIEELSEILECKKDTSSITKKAFNLGISKARAKWSDEDIAIMKQFYSIRTNEELQKEYFPYYSIEQIKNKAKLLGLKKTNMTKYKAIIASKSKLANTWTEEEKSILAEHYGKMNNKILQRDYLPNKTIQAIRKRARLLGIQNKTYQYFVWKNVDVSVEDDMETICFTYEKDLVE